MRARTDVAALLQDAPSTNDRTSREGRWRRHEGDDWDAFDSLPPGIRARLAEHAYDAWSVNALALWKRYRRMYPAPGRAERALIRYFDHCERLERRMFAERWASEHGGVLPHDAARVDVLRYSSAVADVRSGPQHA